MNHKFGPTDIWYLSIISFFSVIFVSFIFYSNNVWKDFPFYVRIIESMNNLKQESVLSYFVESAGKFNKGAPYHFVEFWLAALFKKLDFLDITPTFYYYRISSLSVFLALGIAGILAIYSQFKEKIGLVDVLLCIWVLFLPFTVDELIPISTFDFKNAFYQRPNFIPLFSVLIAILIKLWKEKIDYFFIFLSIASIIFSPLAAVLSGAIMLTVTSFLFFIRKERVFTIKIGLTYFGLLILYLVFYKITGLKSNPYATNTFTEALQLITEIWKAIIGESIKLGIQGLSIFLFYILILFLIKQYLLKVELKLPKLLLVGLLVIFSLSVLTFQMLTGVDNSYQFLFISNVFFGLTLTSLVIYVLATMNEKIWPLIFLTFLIGLSLNKVNYLDLIKYPSIESRFKERTKPDTRKLSKQLTNLGLENDFLIGYETPEGYYDSLPQSNRYPLVYTPYDGLSLFHSDVRFYCFDPLEKVTKGVTNGKVIKKNESFYRIKKIYKKKYEKEYLTKKIIDDEFAAFLLPKESDLIPLLNEYNIFKINKLLLFHNQ